MMKAIARVINGGQDMVEKDTGVQGMPVVQMPAVRPRQRPLSEIAAQAAQEVDDLMRENDSLRSQLSEAINIGKVMSSQLEVMKADNAVLTHERDWYRGRNQQIRNSWDNAVAILADVWRRPEEPTQTSTEEYSQRPEVEQVLNNLEAELTEKKS